MNKYVKQAFSVLIILIMTALHSSYANAAPIHSQNSAVCEGVDVITADVHQKSTLRIIEDEVSTQNVHSECESTIAAGGACENGTQLAIDGATVAYDMIANNMSFGDAMGVTFCGSKDPSLTSCVITSGINYALAGIGGGAGAKATQKAIAEAAENAGKMASQKGLMTNLRR